MQAAKSDSHDGVVTIAAGGASGTDARAASDIGVALSSANLHVMPVLTTDAIGALHDLPDSPVVDLAFTRSDVLDREKVQDPGAEKRIGFVARLFDEEICVLARADVRSLSQLEGRKVGIGVAGSSDSVTAQNVFGKLGLHPQFVSEDMASALTALDAGQLDAVLIVDGKPSPVLFVPRAAGVHLLSIPYAAALQDQYYPARLSHQDYPDLIGEGVNTIAVATLLVAPMQADDEARGARIANFAKLFLTDFDSLLAPGRHPKWKDVNLAADSPGWTRIPAARDWLNSAEAAQEPFVSTAAAQPAPPPSPAPTPAFAQPQPTPVPAVDRSASLPEFTQWNNMRAP